jgi:hypothetical protein
LSVCSRLGIFIVRGHWTPRSKLPPPGWQTWTPERIARHKAWSEKMGDALVRGLNKAVREEAPQPTAVENGTAAALKRLAQITSGPLPDCRVSEVA